MNLTWNSSSLRCEGQVDQAVFAQVLAEKVEPSRKIPAGPTAGSNPTGPANLKEKTRRRRPERPEIGHVGESGGGSYPTTSDQLA